MHEYQYQLDVSGRQTRSIFTQICLCFSLHDTVSRNSIIETLNDGLNMLGESVPWIAGQVVQDVHGWPFVTTSSRHRGVVVNDLSSSLCMQELRSTSFPMSALDEGDLCPVRTLPEPMDEWPVFLVQANFIRDGLLLTCTLQHQVGDMTALGQVMSLFHKACKGEAFTDEGMRLANVDRTDIIPVHDAAWLPEKLHSPPQSPTESAQNAPSSKHQDQPAQSTLTWANFSISPQNLINLKFEAMQVQQSGHFVSTDDVLSALVWRHITRARLARLPPSTTTQFGRTIDMRTRLGIAETYAGEATTKAFVRYDATSLAFELSLGEIASALRQAIDPKASSVTHDFKSYMTLVKRAEASADTPRKSRSVYNPSDVMLSSWAKFGAIWTLDFGLGLGKPQSVRRPLFRPTIGSLVYLLPKDSDGKIVIAVCLRQEDLDNLREDPDWAKWTSWIG